MPKTMASTVEKTVKQGNYASKSEFFRDLLRRHYEEQEVLAVLRESEKEVAEGKGKVLKSLKDLR